MLSPSPPPQSPSTASLRSKTIARRKLLEKAMPLLDKKLLLVALNRVGELDSEWDTEPNAVIEASMSLDLKHPETSASMSSVRRKEKVVMRKPKHLVNVAPSAYAEQCKKQRELVREYMLEKAISIILDNEKMQEKERELLLMTKRNEQESAVSQLISRMATIRVSKWISKCQSTIIEKECQRRAQLQAHAQSLIVAKRKIFVTWRKYRWKMLCYNILSFGKQLYCEKLEKMNDEERHFRLRMASRRLNEDNQVRDWWQRHGKWEGVSPPKAVTPIVYFAREVLGYSYGKEDDERIFKKDPRPHLHPFSTRINQRIEWLLTTDHFAERNAASSASSALPTNSSLAKAVISSPNRHAGMGSSPHPTSIAKRMLYEQFIQRGVQAVAAEEVGGMAQGAVLLDDAEEEDESAGDVLSVSETSVAPLTP